MTSTTSTTAAASTLPTPSCSIGRRRGVDSPTGRRQLLRLARAARAHGSPSPPAARPPPTRRAARERLVWVAARYEQAGDPVEPPSKACMSRPMPRRTRPTRRRRSRRPRTGRHRGNTVPCRCDGRRRHGAGRADRRHARRRRSRADRLLPRRPAGCDEPRRRCGCCARPSASWHARRAPRGVGGRSRRRPTGDEASLRACARPHTAARPARQRLHLPDRPPGRRRWTRTGPARPAASPPTSTAAARATLRVAARSMLQDDAAFAPYGWTHCLSLPHAIFEIMPWLRPPGRAVAVAATYVVAFRGRRGQPPHRSQLGTRTDVDEPAAALDDDPTSPPGPGITPPTKRWNRPCRS